MHRIAVLDDYQSVAAAFADWSQVPEPVEVVEFSDHLADEDALVARLEPFDVVVAMRERTPFPRALLERLPNLRLLVTTGAATRPSTSPPRRERGITVCGTGAHASGPVELTWALILAVARHLPAGGRERPRRRLAADRRHRPRRRHARRRRARAGWGSRSRASGGAFGMDVVAWSQNLTDERAAEVGVRRVEQGRAVRHRGRRHRSTCMLSDRTRGLVGRRRARADEAHRDPGQHLAAARSSTRRRCSTRCAAARIAGAGLDVFDTRAAARTTTRCARAPRAVLTPHLGYVTESDLRGLLPRAPSRTSPPSWPGRRSGSSPDSSQAARHRALLSVAVVVHTMAFPVRP